MQPQQTCTGYWPSDCALQEHTDHWHKPAKQQRENKKEKLYLEGFANRNSETLTTTSRGPDERCETKWCIFPKMHPKLWMEEPSWNLRKVLVRIEADRFYSADMAMWFGIAGHSVNFCSSGLFFSYIVIFKIVELYSVNFVFSSMFSRSEPQTISAKLSSSLSASTWERVIC